jgi:hypothetical protein
MVDTARPWAVWVWRLASYSTFWLTQALGRCTRVASPSTTTASPERAISPRRSHNSARVATKVPSGWQNPSAASLPSSRSMLSPTSVLEIPTIRPARRYDSPVQDHRRDGVQSDFQGKWRVAAHAGWAGWQQAAQAAGQPGQHVCGQRGTRAI